MSEEGPLYLTFLASFDAWAQYETPVPCPDNINFFSPVKERHAYNSSSNDYVTLFGTFLRHFIRKNNCFLGFELCKKSEKKLSFILLSKTQTWLFIKKKLKQ